jgi:transcription antitermination factor NusG
MNMSYWSVVQVESQCEHTVRVLLMRERFETYMPRIKVHGRVWPLFPGYIFVRVIEQFYPIMWTPHVVRLLMSADQPARLPEKTMTEIRKREVGGFVKLPSPTNRLRKGQHVRITRGSFEGQTALCEGMSGKDRVWVLLNLMGQKVPVELPGRDVEPLPVARL